MNAVVQQVIEHQVVEAAQRVETELDNELHRLEHLDEDGLDRLRQRRLLQLKKQAAKRAQWLARGHGAYDGLDSEKDFFAAIRGAERVVCHFFRENWPCKVSLPLPSDYCAHFAAVPSAFTSCDPAGERGPSVFLPVTLPTTSEIL